MNSTPLHHVWTYTDADRRFWDEHLEDWLPACIFDAHLHLNSSQHRAEVPTERMRQQYWVNEVFEPMDAAQAQRCDSIVLPGRCVRHLSFGWTTLEFDLEATNEYVRTECLKRSWCSLALLRPEWSAERVASELDKPGVIGLKPYYTFIDFDPNTRDKHIEAGVFEFLPHHALEVANDRHCWITLHVPKAARLGHPQNIAEIREIRRRYPNIILVVAHLGRSYTLPHAQESLPQLADDSGVYFDIAAVFNPEVISFALKTLGPERLLYGTDNPVFYMRGRRQWKERTYLNRTDYPFHFNKDREPPEVEANYTLYMYEALRAIKNSCEKLQIGSEGVRAILGENSERLVQSVVSRQRARSGSNSLQNKHRG